jgi:hypothetical protein
MRNPIDDIEFVRKLIEKLEGNLLTRQLNSSFRPQRSGEPDPERGCNYWIPVFARLHKLSGFASINI